MCVYACMYVKSALSKDFPWMVNTGCLEGKEMGEWILDDEDLGRFLHFVDGL